MERDTRCTINRKTITQKNRPELDARASFLTLADFLPEPLSRPPRGLAITIAITLDLEEKFYESITCYT